MSDDRETRPIFGEREVGQQLPFGSYPRSRDGSSASPHQDSLREPYAPTDSLTLDIPESAPRTRRTNGSVSDFVGEKPLRRPTYEPAPQAQPIWERFRSRRYIAIAGASVLGIVLIAIIALAMQPRKDTSHTITDFTEINTPLPTTPTATALHFPDVIPGEHNRIGIASGHRGINPENGLPDPGSVCEDGLTEQSVVESISFRVAELLQGAGYTVDILDKWDERLPGYTAQTLVSIHADSCDYINDYATGFKVASYALSALPVEDARLVDCLNRHYEAATGLPQHPHSITPAMTENYVFRLMSPDVPAAIIEVGFLYLDRAVITERANDAASGIAQGILCYLEGE